MSQINPTDFFQWRETSRRLSHWFIVTFILVSVLWFGALHLATSYCFENFKPRPRKNQLFGYGSPRKERTGIPAWFMTVSLAIYTFSSSARRVFKIYRGGASFLPTSLGGVPLSPTSTVLMTPEGRARETILQNVLSEMCLAAGISEPDLYVLPNEASINAMAVGLSPEESSIVITKGALQYLDRDELSGLIGHELSHIINGDARHNTIMTGWLHGYFSLTSVGLFMLTRMWRVLWLIPLGFTLIILGFLGDLAGKLIQAGFNRGRESMADAYSVQFTRDPSCLAGVLKKIGGLDSGSYISYININALECRHLFIAESLKSLFQAHPPLSERVWALEPNWDGYWHDFEADPVDFLKTP